MKNQISTLVLALFIAFSANQIASAQTKNKTAGPLLGWNSYNCYGTHVDAKYTWENLEAFIQKLKPFGYEFYVLDAGWYSHYDLKPGEYWPSHGDKSYMAYDEFGRLVPSPVLFPEGFKPIIEHAKKHGVKFGLHLMRGIPREVVKKNLPIKGTKYRAQDIVNYNDTCNWSNQNYGINMDKPGAQEYYNSVLELVTEWGVEFLKYDDIVHKPREINAVADAIKKTGKRVYLSISPGDDIDPVNFATYQRADMIRISRDIWDMREDIQISFDRWEQILPYADKGFWLDMDMIPFGHIRVNYPISKKNVDQGRGYDRMDYFTSEQRRSFITQRAMAASPLFMGGALITSPNNIFELITNQDMLACNQNGVTGKLLKRIKNYAEFIDIWQVASKSNANDGWVGVFNRNTYMDIVKLSKKELGLKENANYSLYDVWGKKVIDDGESFIFELQPDDVMFISYKLKK